MNSNVNTGLIPSEIGVDGKEEKPVINLKVRNIILRLKGMEITRFLVKEPR